MIIYVKSIRIKPDWNVKDEEGMSYADRAELE